MPECAIEELCRCTAVLDVAYGAEKSCLQSGSYTLILEEASDLTDFKKIINYDTYPCEWANRIGTNGEYISALYLLSDDFSVVVLLPWDKNKPKLEIIMLVPSEVAEIKLCVLNNASCLGHGGVDVLNLFATLNDFGPKEAE